MICFDAGKYTSLDSPSPPPFNMKKTAKIVIQLLDSVSGALDLVPVPCLGLAWKGFKGLWDAVQKV